MPESGPNESKSFGIRGAWILTSGTNLMLGLVAFSVAPVAARVLGPDGRGRLVAIQLVPQLLADLSALGLGFAMVHHGSRHRSHIGTLIRWSVVPVSIGSLVMMAIGYIAAPWVAAGVDDDVRLLRIYLLLCPLTAVLSVLVESLRAVGDFRGWNLILLLRGLTWPVALIVGVGLPDPSLVVVVMVHLLLMLCLLVLLVGKVARGFTSKNRDAPIERSSFVRYGLVSAASTVPRSANARLDQVVMSSTVSRESLGLYAAASGWSALTVPLMRGLSGVTMPHVSSATDDNRLVRVQQITTIGLTAVGLLSVSGIAFTVLFWGPVFGSEYQGALSASIVLIPAALFLEFNSVLGGVVSSLDRPGAVAALESVVMVASTLALVAVLRVDDVLGPAMVSIGTYAIASCGYVAFIARLLGVKIRQLFDLNYLSILVAQLLRRCRVSSGRKPDEVGW